MTAQIIEFPMHRVRPAAPEIKAKPRVVQVQPEVRLSVRVTRAILFWGLVAGIIYGLFFSSSANIGSAQASGEQLGSSQTQSFDYITVMSGDTLWSLAQQYAPNRDPRDFIIDLVALNNLGDSLITPGMRLALPQN